MIDSEVRKLRNESAWKMACIIEEACQRELESRKKFLWIIPMKRKEEPVYWYQLKGFYEGLKQAEVLHCDDWFDIEVGYLRMTEQARKEKRVPDSQEIFDQLKFLCQECSGVADSHKMSNEKKIFEFEGITLYDVDGEIFSEVNGVRQHVKFDAYEDERGIDLSRSNITEKMMLNEDCEDKRLPSKFFAETITYWEPVEEQDEYSRDKIAEYLQNYFSDELDEADEDAKEYWKDILKFELRPEYEIWLAENPEYQDSPTRKRKEAFLKDYLSNKDEILDFNEAMAELYEESDDEDSDEE